MKRAFLIIVLLLLVVLAAGGFLAARRFLDSNEQLESFTLPYVQNFDEVNLRPWYIDDGVWTIRDQTLLQTVGGENPGQIHIPFALPEGQPYHLSTYITLKRDTKSAGVAFNSQLPELTEQQHRVYVAKSGDDTLQLVAGYVDETGTFVPQAQVSLPLELTEFRLDVFVYENAYLVQLNGQRLIEKRPLFYENGLVGFYSIGSAIFDTLKLTTADSVNPGDLVYVSDFDLDAGGAGWVPFNGEWRVSDGQLVQFDPNAYDTGIGYEANTFENYVVQATFSHQQGTGAGILFNMPSPYQLNGAHVVRYSDETDSLIWGSFDAQGTFARQGFTEIEPPGAAPHLLQVFSGADSYDIFLDDRLIARDVPLLQPQGHIGLTTSRSSAGYTLVEVFPLFGSNPAGLRQLTPVATLATAEATAVSTALSPTASTVATPTATSFSPVPRDAAQVVDGDVLSYEAVFTGDFQSSGWRVISGDWRFQQGNLVQADPNGFDYAAVNTNQAYRNYSLQVALEHDQGYGAGVLFNMPFPDKLNGAHLVRYADRRPGAIFWGYYDTDGQFVGQGYADVPEAGTDRHIFRIISRESTYDILLDGNLIASGLPLQQTQGYMGLLTSQATAAFSQVVVGAVGSDPVGDSGTEVQDGFNNVSVLSGRWTTEGNQTVQEITEAGDYIVNLGVSGAIFTMESTITLPEESNAGGGFVFHLPDAGSRRGGQIARLINGGSGLFWGAYDDNGVFQGKGSAQLDLPGNTFLLRLAVERDLMSLWVNDQLVAENVPLERQNGWLGLISFGGPVTFTDLKVEIEE